MFKELVEKQRIVFADRFDSWEDAIRTAAGPLLKEKAIEVSYVDAMINCIKEYGPYVVIAPDIAIPHARSEFGVNKTAISFMKVEEPVSFGDSTEYDARLIFILAAEGNNSHLELLAQMVTVLSDEETVQMLLSSKSIEDINQISE
jgi:PTS system ascorbate-specific IIA component